MGYAEDFISEGLKAGHSIDDLIANMNQSDDEEEKAFASRWLSTASKPEYAPGAMEPKTITGTITPMLSTINEYPKTAGGIAIATAAGLAARKYIKESEKSQMAREKHQMELRRLDIDEQKKDLFGRQVAAQEKSVITPDIQKQAAALSPAAQEAAPKPTTVPGQQPGFTGNAQPTAMPAQQPYGATTINAPTGVPGPAVPPSGAAPQPVAPVAPAPVDPIQAARIRKAEAEAAIAEHKLQQLQAGPKTVASGKAATPGYSEAEMKMVQQGGAASASKALEAQKIAGSVAPKPDPIAATATPAEKASAVAAVQQSELKTGSGFPAHAGKAPPVEDITKFRMPAGGDLGDLSKLPSNLAFVPGFGPGLNTARQELGQEAAQALARQQGLPWGEHNAARARLDEFNKERIGPALTREQRKSIGAPLLENTRGIGMKAGKALGVLGAIMSVADLAKAAEQTKEGKYTEAAKTVAPVVDPTGLASAAISPESTAQSLANVSPIMGILSQLIGEESKTKAKREYARKVGAGRGIAPPSAYQR